MDGVTIIALILLGFCPLLVGTGWVISQTRGIGGLDLDDLDDD